MFHGEEKQPGLQWVLQKIEEKLSLLDCYHIVFLSEKWRRAFTHFPYLVVKFSLLQVVGVGFGIQYFKKL